MVNKLRILALFGAVGLMACAGPPRRTEAARLQFDPAQCVASIGQLPLTPISRAPEKPKRLKALRFDQIAGCVLAADGQAVPLAVFALDGVVPAELKLELRIHQGIAFAAAVDLLDAEYRLLRTASFDDLVRRADAYTGSVFLNESAAAARFLVLRPDVDAVGKSDESVRGVTNQTTFAVVAGSALYAGSFVTGSEVVTQTWLSELGEFTIWMRSNMPVVANPQNTGN